MSSNRRMLVMTLLVGVMGLMFASFALADNPPQITEQSATFSVTQTDKAVVAVNAKGKIQMRFILRNGLPKAKQTNCVVAANDNKPGHIKIGTVIGNSGILRSSGRWGKFVDKVKAGDKFCRTGVGPTGWQKVKCGNFVWLKLVSRKGFIPYGRIELVQDFLFKATVRVVATAKGTATAVATCISSPGNWSQAYGHGEGSAYATATVTFTAKSKALALDNATARVLAIVLSQEGTARGGAIATASGQAKATASCSSQPAPVPTLVPPVVPPVVPPPAVHACSLGLSQDKTFNNVVYAYANTNGESVAKVRYFWDYSRYPNQYEDQNTNRYAHTYPVQSSGPYGTGITYQIRAVAYFGDGQTRDCGTLPFWYPAPPPGGSTAPPPLPPG